MTVSPKPEHDTIEGICPICDRPRSYEARPFCSIRCKEVDLGRWFKGAYAIPVKEADEDEGDYED